MGKVRFKPSRAGFNDVRKSPAVVALLQQHGNAIATDATAHGRRTSLSGTDTTYEVEISQRATRAAAIVKSGDFATTAVNVGRGRSRTVGSKGRGVTDPRKDLLRAMNSV